MQSKMPTSFIIMNGFGSVNWDELDLSFRVSLDSDITSTEEDIFIM